ncbi:ATP synthase subunit I [Leptolyngbya sp. BC1307]|uniref:ATP synthase subunit I n=1 Tax=Leptolyngbya sp. BC1307 TaxID=2029589 RepID=UPI001F0B60C3|nr:ATP synthase subunit I [Leptolyngbya sp. BC1307]
MTFAEKTTKTPDESLATEESDQAEQEPAAVQLPPPTGTAMQDYYQLQQTLLRLTVAFSAVIFLFVWGFYSLNTALNYVIGACTGVVYLRMLARSVGKIGREAPKSSSGRLAVLIGVLVVSTQWQQLSVLPVFLGFLTYKAALITFVLWTAVLPQKKAM